MKPRQWHQTFWLLEYFSSLRFIRLFFLYIGLFVATTGCQPVTFSKKSTIDFRNYSSGCVEVLESVITPLYFRSYFKDEMIRESGFVNFYESCDEGGKLEFYLYVSLEDSDDETRATISFTTEDLFGNKPYSGVESDSNTDENEAIEDALDEIAKQFLRSYRI